MTEEMTRDRSVSKYLIVRSSLWTRCWKFSLLKNVSLHSQQKTLFFPFGCNLFLFRLLHCSLFNYQARMGWVGNKCEYLTLKVGFGWSVNSIPKTHIEKCIGCGCSRTQSMPLKAISKANQNCQPELPTLYFNQSCILGCC